MDGAIDFAFRRERIATPTSMETHKTLPTVPPIPPSNNTEAKKYTANSLSDMLSVAGFNNSRLPVILLVRQAHCCAVNQNFRRAGGDMHRGEARGQHGIRAQNYGGFHHAIQGLFA
jgi:hypothetical protein